jgi:hypothetical protein
MNDTGMKLASVSDTMAGESPSQGTPASTTLALIEQGLKVFTAIYKRVFRSLSQEFRLLYRLNSIYLDEATYFRVLDNDSAILKQDYNLSSVDVVPISDPSLASDTQRIARSQAMMQTLQMNPSVQGKIQILKDHYEAIGVENIEKYLPEEEIKQQLSAPAPPDPKLLELQLKEAQQQFDNAVNYAKNNAGMALITAQIEKLKADTEKVVIETAALPVMNQFQVFKAHMEHMHEETRLDMERMKAQGGMNGKGTADGASVRGAGGMAPLPNNEESAGLPEGDSEGVPGAGDIGPDSGPEFGGGDGVENIDASGANSGPGFDPGAGGRGQEYY